MTDTQFRSRSFRHSMPYDYLDKRTSQRISCLLVAVDFDKEVLCLWPIPEKEIDINYPEFWVNYELCELPLPTLKKV